MSNPVTRRKFAKSVTASSIVAAAIPARMVPMDTPEDVPRSSRSGTAFVKIESGNAVNPDLDRQNERMGWAHRDGWEFQGCSDDAGEISHLWFAKRMTAEDYLACRRAAMDWQTRNWGGERNLCGNSFPTSADLVSMGWVADQP